MAAILKVEQPIRPVTHALMQASTLSFIHSTKQEGKQYSTAPPTPMKKVCTKDLFVVVLWFWQFL
jgi:hypothetical protein